MPFRSAVQTWIKRKARVRQRRADAVDDVNYLFLHFEFSKGNWHKKSIWYVVTLMERISLKEIPKNLLKFYFFEPREF